MPVRPIEPPAQSEEGESKAPVTGAADTQLATELQKIAKLARSGDDTAAHLALEMMMDGLKGNRPLPEPKRFADITEDDQREPPILIQGMLYQGGKLLISAPSKARKTWLLIDLCLSLSSGMEWLGIGTSKTRVLFLDCELMQFDTWKRIKAVADARSIWDSSGLDVWSLRGHRLSLERLRPHILKHCRENEIGAIAMDPLYRVMEGADENSNGEIADFLCGIEEIAHEAGASVLLSHHFAKGNSAGKNSIDRMSGAGTFARDPDCLISLTEAEASTEDAPAFIFEPTVRSFKPMKPFALVWEFPIWKADRSMSTKLKDGAGRPKEGDDPTDLVRLLEEHGELQTKEFEQLARDEKGIPSRRFFDALKQIKKRLDLNERKEGKRVFYSILPDEKEKKGLEVIEPPCLRV